MIVAIEGPDRVGKTTVWRALMAEAEFAGARFVPNVSADSALIGAGDAVQLASEMRVDAWWRALYVPRTLYVCDRCPFVSNLVYAVVHGRSTGDRNDVLRAWADRLFIARLDADDDVLLSRGATPTEVSAAFVYRSVLAGLRSTRIDASKPRIEVVNDVKEVLRNAVR